MRLIKILLSLCFLVLAGCSEMPKAPATITEFNMQGLVGVTTPDAQNNANFNWYQHEGSYHIELYGPMALGTTYLDGNAQKVRLTLSDQEDYTADSPEILMQNVLGWAIPVAGLQYWLFAHPVPNQDYTQIPATPMRPQHLSQQGWEISYTWKGEGNFPYKIVLTRPGIKVVIIINKVY